MKFNESDRDEWEALYLVGVIFLCVTLPLPASSSAAVLLLAAGVPVL